MLLICAVCSVSSVTRRPRPPNRNAQRASALAEQSRDVRDPGIHPPADRSALWQCSNVHAVAIYRPFVCGLNWLNGHAVAVSVCVVQ